MSSQRSPQDFGFSDTNQSGDAYSQVASDVNQTASLGVSLIQLTRTLGGSWYHSARAAKELKASLGIWADEAFDGKKRLRQPSVDTKAFESHLDRHDGIFTISGDCTGTSGWAHLLHALGVKPGMAIVRWRARRLMQSGESDVRLEMEGPTICHIVNVYETCGFKSHVKKEYGPAEDDIRLSFGRLSWKTTRKNTIEASFEPGTAHGEGLKIEPFAYTESSSSWDSSSVHFEKGTLWTSYLMCLQYYVSDSNEHLLIHAAWLEQAHRIRARALLNGGDDLSFYRAVERELLSAVDPADTETRELRQREAREAFQVDNPQFFYFDYSRSRAFPVSVQDIEQSAVKVLQQYATEPKGSWKWQLQKQGTLDRICELVQWDPFVELDKSVRVIHLTSTSSLWQGLVKME